MSGTKPTRRLSVHDVLASCRRGERLAMVTCYDYTSGVIVDRSGIPVLLVGDSLGMVVQGNDSTLPVTVDEIVYHTRAVARGAARALIVADLPFLSYTTPEQALASAGRLLAEGGAGAVKLEGGRAVAATVRRLVEAGIPVMGHLGLTPQSINQLGHRAQGLTVERAEELIRDADALQAAGAWALVLELVPTELAGAITDRLAIPTIGIGSGPSCSGEVQVWHDVLGLYPDFQPRHSRQYAALADAATDALERLSRDVRAREFPGPENTVSMAEEVLSEALARSATDAMPASGPRPTQREDGCV